MHVGMDSESGDLLAIYDWELQCRPARRGDSRRWDHMLTLTNIYTLKYAFTHTHTNTCTHTHTNTHTHTYVHMHTHTHIHRLKQVGSIQQEFDSYQQRALHHPNLVQYLAMTHSLVDNKIKVEVCGVRGNM